MVVKLETTGGFGQPRLRAEVSVPGLELDPDEQRELFEPFGKDQDRLFLPIARQLARHQDAELTVSQADRGSLFVLRLDPGRVGEGRMSA